MNIQYKKTGNDVQVSKQELEIFIRNKIDEYNKLDDKSKSTCANPYVDTLFYKTSNGKMIEIPKDIQNEVLSLTHTTDVAGYDDANGGLTNINYNNDYLGLHNQDHLYKSSVRPFDKIITHETKMPMLNDNVVVKDIDVEHADNTDKCTNDTCDRIEPDIKHINVIKESNNHFYIILCILILAICAYLYFKK